MPYIIQANRRTYTVEDDLTIIYQVLIVGVVTDEVLIVEAGTYKVSNKPLRAKLTVQVDRPFVTIKALDGGLFSVSGYAEEVFPPPSNTVYAMQLTFSAPGYRTKTHPESTPQGGPFPIRVAEALRPLPVRLQGRVTDDTTDRNPIVGALVFAFNLPGLVEKMVILRAPLQFPHGGGTPAVDGNGTGMNLTREADAGDGVLFLDSQPVGSITINDADSESRSLGALTGPQGYYNLNGMGRVRELRLMVSAAGHAPIPAPVVWTINYGRPVNVLDFRLP